MKGCTPWQVQSWVYAKLEAYHVGSERAVTAHAIAFEMSSRFGAEVSEREVREAVSELRMAGSPIASSCRPGAKAGFFIPATEEEALATIESMRHRAKMVSMAASGVERGLRKRFRDQLVLSFNPE